MHALHSESQKSTAQACVDFKAVKIIPDCLLVTENLQSEKGLEKNK